MSNSSIWSIDMTLSGAITSGLSGTGSDGNERVPCIPKISSITGVLWDLLSYIFLNGRDTQKILEIHLFPKQRWWTSAN